MNKLAVLSTALLALGVVSQAQADQAERWPRWYVGLSGGVNFLEDTDIKGSESGKASYNAGGIGTVSLGYMPAIPFQPFNNMRIEAEGGYHYSGLDSAHVNGAPVTASGSLRSISYMGNLYYDLRNSSQFTPYVGAGAGGARVSLSKSSGLGNSGNEDNVFAYQFMAGISFAPQTIPMTEWSLGYRYFAENSPSFNTTAGRVKLDSPASSNVEVGAKFRF